MESSTALDGTFQLIRMVPPGTIYFYFSIQDAQFYTAEIKHVSRIIEKSQDPVILNYIDGIQILKEALTPALLEELQL
jgi:hypothetical protein